MQVIITGEEIIAIVSIICMAIVLCVICITASRCSSRDIIDDFKCKHRDTGIWTYSYTEPIKIRVTDDEENEKDKKEEKN